MPPVLIHNRRFSRAFLVGTAACLLISATSRGVTPELGKNRLRQLVRLPAITFAQDWSFDPERGFKVGSADQDLSGQIKDLRKQLASNADDADGYRALGELYSEADDRANARRANARAVQLYRQRMELQPDSPVLLADFGSALAETGKTDEAETILRRAVQLGPNEWKCWLALGRFLDAAARQDVSEGMRSGAVLKPGTRAGAKSNDIASDRVALARKRLGEAGQCYDHALTNAPEESAIYLRRGLHRTLQSVLLNQIDIATGATRSQTEILSDFFSAASVADLRKASNLNPKDYRLIGNLALFEIYGINARNGREGLSGESGWAAMPDGSQESLRAAMTRLEDLAEEGDPKIAAGASEMLGILQGPILHESATALLNLRRAVSLDPSREHAWELATGTLARSGEYQDLLFLCEDRLRSRDSLRGHLILAKACEKLGHWEDAEEEVLTALKDSPDDFTANLSLAVLLLKKGDDEDLVAQAGSWLQRCDKLLSQMPAAQKTRERLIDYNLTQAIFLGLSGEFDAARRWASSVVSADPDNDRARDILSAMNY